MPANSLECEVVKLISEEIARFIETNIESVDQLEILRLLVGDPEKEWNTEALACEAQIPPRTIRLHLDALERRGFLSVVRGPVLSSRYCPRTATLGDDVHKLLQLYNERPVTIIRLIYARAKRPLNIFADPSPTGNDERSRKDSAGDAV